MKDDVTDCKGGGGRGGGIQLEAPSVVFVVLRCGGTGKYLPDENVPASTEFIYFIRGRRNPSIRIAGCGMATTRARRQE